MSQLIKKIKYPTAVNNLISESSTDYLAAAQGKALNDLITALNDSIEAIGGLIFKTGIKDGSTGNGDTLTFGTPFPTACILVLPMPDGAYDATYAEVANVSNITASGFNWNGSLIGSGSSNVTGKYLAVGY